MFYNLFYSLYSMLLNFSFGIAGCATDPFIVNDNIEHADSSNGSFSSDKICLLIYEAAKVYSSTWPVENPRADFHLVP